MCSPHRINFLTFSVFSVCLSVSLFFIVFLTIHPHCHSLLFLCNTISASLVSLYKYIVRRWKSNPRRRPSTAANWERNIKTRLYLHGVGGVDTLADPLLMYYWCSAFRPDWIYLFPFLSPRLFPSSLLCHAEKKIRWVWEVYFCFIRLWWLLFFH